MPVVIHVYPVLVEGYPFLATEVVLPNTNLLIIQTTSGYVMCGALDVQLLREKLQHRGILAARAIGVRTMDELLHGVVESCTQRAEDIGIHRGTPIREALLLMHDAETTLALGAPSTYEEARSDDLAPPAS